MNFNLSFRVFEKLFEENSLGFEFRGFGRFDLDILVSFWAVLHFQPSWVAVRQAKGDEGLSNPSTDFGKPKIQLKIDRQERELGEEREAFYSFPKRGLL